MVRERAADVRQRRRGARARAALHLAEGVRTVDLGEVTELDSSPLALLLAWLREARSAGAARARVRQPARRTLPTLARLYGVDDLLRPPRRKPRTLA